MKETSIKNPAGVTWFDVTRWRREGAQRFGPESQLPWVDLSVAVQRYLSASTEVLDVGAGVEQHWRQFVGAARYASMDIDTSGTFDYRTFEDVKEGIDFDVILMNQLLEHLTIPEACETLSLAREHLRPTGALIATVPNPAHPVRQWGDATHITAWPAFDLYGLFKACGFEIIELARFGKRKLPRNLLRRWVVQTIAHEFRIDWADSILLVASPRSTPVE